MNRKQTVAFVIIASMYAGACAHVSPKIEYRDVIKAVPVPCKVQQPAVPSYATDSVDLSAPIFDLVKAVLIELQQRKAETIELRAANKACS